MGKIVEKIKKICPSCNKEFYVRPCEDKKYIYCSVECRMKSKRITKNCTICGKEYYVYKDRKNSSKYCSNECKLIGDKDTYIIKICPNCGKEFKVYKCKEEENPQTYCSRKCRKEASTVLYKCDCCGKEFRTTKYKFEHSINGLFCSKQCSLDFHTHGVTLKCDNCGKEIYKMQCQIYDKNFCSVDCQKEYRHNHAQIVERVCEYCHKSYTVKKKYEDTTRFCSQDCKNKWCSENYIGENSPHFTSKKMKCELCGKEIFVEPYKIGKQYHYFCSRDCSIKYYCNVENRTEKQKKADKWIAKNAINYIKPTLSQPHKDVIKMLNEMNIYIRIEELIKYYKLDVYLPNNNLAIEVMGDYWHCSPIRFKNITYSTQLECIKKDKSKDTYVKNKFGYHILYLWERDIIKNPLMCKRLIEKYIQCKGVLDNYNSFNYSLQDDNIVLNDNIIKPYHEQSIEEYRHLIKIKK